MPESTERAALQEYLQAQRDSVVDIVAGLDEEGLHRSVVPSGWSPSGLIMHLAGAERYWCNGLVAGEVIAPDPGRPPGDPGLSGAVGGLGSGAERVRARRCAARPDPGPPA